MVRPLHAIKAMVLLIGNYPPDRQESMRRFAMMMLDGLTAADRALVSDAAVLGQFEQGIGVTPCQPAFCLFLRHFDPNGRRPRAVATGLPGESARATQMPGTD